MKKLFVYFIIIFSYSCNSYRTHSIVVDKSTFGDYPGVFLNLANEKIIKYPNDIKSQLNGIEADLWIEPRDPEISGIDSMFEKIKHIGSPTKITILNINYETVNFNSIKDITIVRDGIDKNQIQNGTVFVTQASDKSIYKVQIFFVDSKEQEIILKYQLLH